jgi:hypothetical protein
LLSAPHRQPQRKKPRAREDSLGELHEILARHLTEAIQNGEASPSLLNVARQFLKDNGIECIVEGNETMKTLLDTLPSFMEQEDEDKISVKQ